MTIKAYRSNIEIFVHDYVFCITADEINAMRDTDENATARSIARDLIDDIDESEPLSITERMTLEHELSYYVWAITGCC